MTPLHFFLALFEANNSIISINHTQNITSLSANAIVLLPPTAKITSISEPDLASHCWPVSLNWPYVSKGKRPFKKVHIVYKYLCVTTETGMNTDLS